MRSLRFAFAVLAAAMAGLVSQAAVSSPAEAGSCHRGSHHHAKVVHHHAPKMKAHHHHHHAKPAAKKAAPKKAHHHHHHVKAAPPARPGKCGTFKYYKGGKCLDARNKK